MQIMSCTCKCCGQTKTKVQKREGKKFTYVDQNNTLWLGKYCPDCKKQYYANYKRPTSKTYTYNYTPKPTLDVECIVCETKFQTKNPNVKLCSISCRKKHRNILRRKIKNCKTCGNKIDVKNKQFCSDQCYPKKSKHLITKKCLTCKNEFIAKRSHKKYCSVKCQPNKLKYKKTINAKQSRKQRKCVEKFKQPISKKFKKEIIAIYENKTLGQRVDHIIPINHPDVCGLHVPWNLTYLDAKENTIKSNIFDYTMENTSWKKFRKVG